MKLTNRRKLSKILLSRTLRNSARDLGYPEVPKLFPGGQGAKIWLGIERIGLLGVPVATPFLV